MDLLSPHVGLAVWTILTFVVVLLVLRRYAWKPILEAMEARERGIQKLIDDAEKARAEAEELLKQYRRKLEEARVEGARFLTEGKAAAEQVREEMLERARAEAEAIVTRAGHEIDLERQKAVAEIKEQAVDLAISAASKVIEEDLNDARHRRLVEDYLREIEASPQVIKRGKG
jgi:F-type H+-transporting ATPase subunit b